MALVAVAWCVTSAAVICRFGAMDQAKASDCVIVLGAAVRGGEPSPVFEERIRHGIKLYRSGQAPKILFTGGVGDGQSRSESAMARSFAVRQGVPAEDILIEESSRSTKGNLEEARQLMRRHGLSSAIVVSDPLHMRRAMLIADRLGISAVSSPTPTTRYRSLNTQLPFLFRELYYLHRFVATGN